MKKNLRQENLIVRIPAKVSSFTMTTPQRRDSHNNDHLFIGGSGQCDLPLTSSAKATPEKAPVTGAPKSPRQITKPSSSARRRIKPENPPESAANNTSTAITVIGITIGLLGLIGLGFLLFRTSPVAVHNSAHQPVQAHEQKNKDMTSSVNNQPALIQSDNTSGPSKTVAKNPPATAAVNEAKSTTDKPKTEQPTSSSVLLPVNPASSNNIISNPSVEIMDGGKPQSWRKVIFHGTADMQVSDVARSGKNSLKISSREGGDAAWAMNVKVKPNTEYTFSSWVRTENIDGEGKGVLLFIIGTREISSSLKGTNDWTQLSFTFNAKGRTDIDIGCLYGGWGMCTGTAWYDDVSLVEVTK
jgi:hypothetical protein